MTQEESNRCYSWCVSCLVVPFGIPMLGGSWGIVELSMGKVQSCRNHWGNLCVWATAWSVSFSGTSGKQMCSWCMECLSLETLQRKSVTQVANQPLFGSAVQLLKAGGSIRIIPGRWSAAQLPGQGLLQLWLQVLFYCVPDSSPEMWAMQMLVCDSFLLGVCGFVLWGWGVTSQPKQGQGHWALQVCSTPPALHWAGSCILSEKGHFWDRKMPCSAFSYWFIWRNRMEERQGSETVMYTR